IQSRTGEQSPQAIADLGTLDMGIEVDLVSKHRARPFASVTKQRTVSLVVEPLVQRLGGWQKQIGRAIAQRHLSADPAIKVPAALLATESLGAACRYACRDHKRSAAIGFGAHEEWEVKFARTPGRFPYIRIRLLPILGHRTILETERQDGC